MTAQTTPEVAALLAQIAALQAALISNERKLTCKVSEKGAISVYGLGKFPVTLYARGWERLLNEADAIRAFAAANAHLLSAGKPKATPAA